MKNIKKCPFFFLIVLSGFCVYLYGGFHWLQKQGILPKETAEAKIETASKEAETINQDMAGSDDAMNTDIMVEESTGKETAEKATPKKESIKEGATGKETTEKEETKNGAAGKNTAKNEIIGKESPIDENREEVNEALESTENEKIIGVTNFEFYEPKQISSPYYSDPGKRALTTEYPYESVEDDYFADAAFIGDSRMIGVFDYAGLKSTDFFCDKGFCTYLWSKNKTLTCWNTRQKATLEEHISGKRYTKIYVMLGLNDCGYGNVDDFKDRYSQMIDMLHEKQPDAVIYLLSNLPLTKAKSDKNDVLNNDDINAHNVAIAELADGETFFYLEYSTVFLDSEWNLKPEFTFDGVHLFADGYIKWMDYFRQHAVAW